MKKFTKVLLIISACLAGLGVLFTAFGLWWSMRVVDRLTPEEAINQYSDIQMDSLTSLVIDTGVSEVRFKPIDDSIARPCIQAYGFSEGELTIEQKNGTLFIQCRDALGGKSIINLGIFRIDWLGRLHTGTLEQRIIDIYLPEGTELSSFKLDADVGNVQGMLPISAKDMSVSCGTGNVELSAFHADTLALSQGTGNVALADYSCGHLTLSGGLGELTLTNGAVSGSAQIDMGMGNVVIDGGVWNALDVNGGAGNFSFAGRLTGASSVEAGMGNVMLTLEDSAEQYAVTLSKGVGEIHAEGAQFSVSEDGSYAINAGSGAPNNLYISMGTGNIDLIFPEN